MKRQTAHRIYDVLEDYGADWTQRDTFVRRHVNPPVTCTEWRWQGVLGFGGKLYTHRLVPYVDCYQQDETPTRLQAIQEINEKLKEIAEGR